MKRIEMRSQIDKRFVLFNTCSFYSNKRFTLFIIASVITTVASCSCKLFYFLGMKALIFKI
jgi:hypothetical protein